jgi:hypothetical protein
MCRRSHVVTRCARALVVAVAITATVVTVRPPCEGPVTRSAASQHGTPGVAADVSGRPEGRRWA